MKRERNIYVVNKGYHNYEPAKSYGKFVFLSEDSIPRMAIGQMMRQFYPLMEHSEPTDFILTGGLANMVGVACGIFAAKHHCLNLLIWAPSAQEYAIRSVVFPREVSVCA